MASKDHKLTKSDITQLGLRSAFLQSSFSFERMQAGGWTWAFFPVWKRLYGEDKEKWSQSMVNNMEFINTAPPLVSILMGLLASLEEEQVDQTTIKGLKNALFGPLAGIGDAIFWFTLLPIVGGISASLASQGNVLGPIFFLAVYIGLFILRVPMCHFGYRLGVKAIDRIQENSELISRSATILGVTVIGGLISSYVSLAIKLKVQGVDFQSKVLDNILPNLLPFGVTFLMYWLLKKQVSPLVLILVIFIIAIVGAFFGIL